jgi:hypothetical protein
MVIPTPTVCPPGGSPTRPSGGRRSEGRNVGMPSRRQVLCKPQSMKRSWRGLADRVLRAIHAARALSCGDPQGGPAAAPGGVAPKSKLRRADAVASPAPGSAPVPAAVPATAFRTRLGHRAAPATTVAANSCSSPAYFPRSSHVSISRDFRRSAELSSGASVREPRHLCDALKRERSTTGLTRLSDRSSVPGPIPLRSRWHERC